MYMYVFIKVGLGLAHFYMGICTLQALYTRVSSCVMSCDVIRLNCIIKRDVCTTFSFSCMCSSKRGMTF